MRYLASTALALLVLALVACQAAPPATPPAATAPPTATTAPSTATTAPSSACPKTGGTLTISFVEEVRALNTIEVPGTEGMYVMKQVYDGLVNADSSGNVIPGLAESWEQPDDTTYIFHLRKGVKFHDGTDFDANDVKYSYERVKSEESRYADLFDRIKTVEVVDPYTVRMTLSRPWGGFFALISNYAYADIVSQEAIEKWGEDYGTKAVVGTGPFKFVEWVKDDHITLVRNEDYWGQVPCVESVIYRPITEDETRLIAFETGRVDLLFDVPFPNVGDLEADPNVLVQRHGSGIVNYLFFNTTQPPFDDEIVRKAVRYAIDKKTLTEIVYYDEAEPAAGLFPLWHWAHNDSLPIERDLDQAKALLQEAGYSSDNPLRFSIITTPASMYYDQAVIVQQQLAEADIEVEIEPVEKAAWGGLVTRDKEGNYNSEYESSLYRLIFNGPYTDDFSWRILSSETVYNLTGYNLPGGAQNDAAAELMSDVTEITDQEEAAEQYQRLDALVYEDCPLIVLSFVNNVNAMHDYVKGFNTFASDNVPLEGVWLDK